MPNAADGAEPAQPDRVSAASASDESPPDWSKFGSGAKGAQNSGAIYALGTIGALVWFLGRAHGPKGYVLGVLKSFVWPAYLVFGVFKLLSGDA